MGPTVTVCILSQKRSSRLERELNGQTHRPIQVIYADIPGIVPAMNHALNMAKGEIFVRIDDDVILPKEWLAELVKPFFNPNVAGVTGPTFIPCAMRKKRDSINIANNPNWFLKWLFDDRPFAAAKIYKCGSVSYGSNFIDKMERRSYYDIDHLEGTNWAMRTELIRAVGGFDPAFDGVAEWFDTDVEFKIKNMGYRLAYQKKAFLWHIVNQGGHFQERYDGVGRMKNWLRFHIRHSRFHPKKIIWFLMMGGYFLWQQLRQLFQRLKGVKIF